MDEVGPGDSASEALVPAIEQGLTPLAAIDGSKFKGVNARDRTSRAAYYLTALDVADRQETLGRHHIWLRQAARQARPVERPDAETEGPGDRSSMLHPTSRSRSPSPIQG